MTIEVPERELLGIPFATLDLPAVIKILSDRPAAAPFTYVATPNAHHLGLLHRGADGFAFGLSRAWFLTCDSKVLQGIGRMLFSLSLPVVTGSDLTLYLLRHVIEADDPVTIIGGSEELRGDLARQFGLRRIALYSPPFGFSREPAQLQTCVDFIRANPGRFVFLACGAPQSEVLGAHLVEIGGASGIGLCIGASLLFATGRLKRAPRAWQIFYLEWLYRLTQERRRLLRRLWNAQLPVLRIAISARLSRPSHKPHASRLDRPPNRQATVNWRPASDPKSPEMITAAFDGPTS
jgi:exopolysaccharide biosynthesis WecB/TagA/CpsF family protein